MKTATVVLSRVPPEEAEKNGARFNLLVQEFESAGVPVCVIDSFYDFYDHEPAAEFLRALAGDMIVLGWHYPRATKWILARHNVEVNGFTRKLHCIDAREVKPETLLLKITGI